MSNRVDQRTVGSAGAPGSMDPGLARTSFGICLITALVAFQFIPPRAAHAQVGHAPTSSPYRDILHRSSVTFTWGRFRGDGGKLGIGAHDGNTYGIRFDRQLSGLVQFGAGVTYADLQRLVTNPNDSVADRVRGPFKQSVVLADIGLQFNLTGAKTWHGLAPFFEVRGGFAFGSSTPEDATGYKFGTKLVATPGIGTRIFVSQRINLRLQAGLSFWKLKYPATYTNEPSKEPGAPPLITDGKLDQWTNSAWYTAGVGIMF